MTFSDSRISNLLQKEWIVCWESVAPVKMVTFDLGEGRQLKGAISGEIAIYFCTPEGKVFDILPALQSPAVTLNSIKQAHTFYQKHGANLKIDNVKELHLARMKEFAGNKFDKLNADPAKLSAAQVFPESKKGEDKREQYIKAATDAATRDLRTMVLSKSAVVISDDDLIGDSAITVVEPGGREYYQWQIAKIIHGSYNSDDPTKIFGSKELSDLRIALAEPSQWKKFLFTDIMKQELKGGNVKYSSDSLEAIHIMEE